MTSFTLNITPVPHDRELYIVTLEGDYRQVQFSDEHSLYEKREVFCRTDGESGSWEPEEILGWTDDYATARAVSGLMNGSAP